MTRPRLVLPPFASLLAFLALAAGTLTCDGDNIGPHADPAQIASAGGDGQTAPIGTVLPLPLVILVTDAEGRPVPNVAVTWNAIGGGTVSSSSVKTNNDGQASIQRTLGTHTGTQTTVAMVSGLSGSPVMFTATASAPGSESMALTRQGRVRCWTMRSSRPMTNQQ